MTAATVGAAKDAAKAKAKEEAMKEMAKVVPGLTGCQGFCAKFDDGMFCVKKPAIFFLFLPDPFNIFCSFVLLFFFQILPTGFSYVFITLPFNFLIAC